jgi:UDP-2,3-diacylglucosamine pyrophosphatase LpxH
MQEKLHHKTIVLSDLHLGSKWSKASEVLKFLKRNSCDTLILCGDIIDGWSILRGSRKKWRRKHTNVLKYILSMHENTKIIYIRGNHDDFLDRVQPLRFGNISIVRDYIYESFGKRYYVIHGDEFDNITTNWKLITRLGDIGYSLLLNINSLYNKRRSERNKSYRSISKIIKHKVKSTISYIGEYENHITEVAKQKNCDGVICGHIHYPEKKYIGDLLYLNSGDWIESLSAVIEENDGSWHVFHYYTEGVIDENRDKDSLSGIYGIQVPATI